MLDWVAADEIETFLFRSPIGNPLRCLKFEKGICWYPKAEVGREWKASPRAEKFGLWGGTVASYGVGFNRQQVELHFAGIDIDKKNGQNEKLSIGQLRQAVLCTVGTQCSVRTSSSGEGLHLFAHIKPIMCANKAQAQRVAEAVGAPIVQALNNVGVVCDKVACNQLWVLGGCQEWLNKVDEATIEWLGPLPSDAVKSNGTPVDPSRVGPRCKEFLAALGGAAKSRVYLAEIQAAVRGTKWERVFQHDVGDPATYTADTTITIQGGSLVVYSFLVGRVMLSMPMFL